MLLSFALLLVFPSFADEPGVWEQWARHEVATTTAAEREELRNQARWLEDLYANRWKGHLYQESAFALNRIAHHRIAVAHEYIWGQVVDPAEAARKLEEAGGLLRYVQEHYGHAVGPDGSQGMESDYGLAVVAWHAGRMDDARVLVDRALELEPDDALAPQALLLAGDLAMAAGEAELAGQHYAAALQRFDEATAQVVREALDGE